MNEQDDLILLTTEAIRRDLLSNNRHIVMLALSLISLNCTPQMAKTIMPTIEPLLKSNDASIRKKAIFACVKLIRVEPNLSDVFASHLSDFIATRHHGVLMAGIVLMQELLRLDPEKFVPLLRKVNLFSIS